MSLPYSKPVILYAEDDQDDFEVFKDALMQETDKYSLVQANNGTEVISFLEQHPDSLPGIIVLDLNMPVMDGKQTLQWLKQNEQFKDIPVMVFTTSSREDDIKLCKTYDCTFFRKPTLYRDLLHIIQIILQICEQQKTA
jgi:CheY-like chemotaxis protein